MLTQVDLHTAVDHAVKNLRRAVRNVRKFYGNKTPIFPESLIDHPIIHLRDELLQETKVFSNRNVMLAKLPFPRTGICAEVGTSTGIFARQIINTLNPSELHVYDIDFSRFDKSILDIRGVQMHRGDSVSELERLPDNILDFAYVDANHSYKSVRSEIAILKRKVKNGGYIMFNDYTRWSISEVLSYGVLSAVNEFLTTNNLPLIGIALTGTGHFDVATQLKK